MSEKSTFVGAVHTCPRQPVSHHGGVVTGPGADSVLINGKPAVRMGDAVACVDPNCVLTGVGSVRFQHVMAAREEHLTIHTGNVRSGSPNVLIGGPAVGPAGLPVTVLPDGSIQNGSAFTIKGSDYFKAKAFRHLAHIGSTNAGTTILTNIEQSGNSVQIVETTDNNGYASPADWEDAGPKGQLLFDGHGQPLLDENGKQRRGTGRGTDTVVEIHPDHEFTNKRRPDLPVPPETLLFHELKHAEHNAQGESDQSPDKRYHTNEERQTIVEDPPAEADYLRERGYPWRRSDHGQLNRWVRNP